MKCSECTKAQFQMWLEKKKKEEEAKGTMICLFLIKIKRSEQKKKTSNKSLRKLTVCSVCFNADSKGF